MGHGVDTWKSAMYEELLELYKLYGWDVAQIASSFSTNVSTKTIRAKLSSETFRRYIKRQNPALFLGGTLIS